MRTLLVCILCLNLSACAEFIYKGSCSAKYGEGGFSIDRIVSRTDLKPVFDGIAASLCDGNSFCAMQDPRAADPTLLVTDFVDIQSLKPYRGGILMGELMRGSLSTACCARILQGEFSMFFRLSENGLVALTRDPKSILTKEYRHSECVVGTYHYTTDKLYLFARRINIYTGVISKFVSREITFICPGETVISRIE